jgi:hypothetical protein
MRLKTRTLNLNRLSGRFGARILRLIASFVGLLILLLTSNRTFSLQSEVEWTPIRRIAGYADDTFPPYLLADQNRTVHAFAIQFVGEESPQKAIVYCQWTEAGGWTNPIDILLPPNGPTTIYAAFLDQKGTLHLAFQGGDTTSSNVYYSMAPVTSAGRATSWSEPKVIGEGAIIPASGAIIGDEKDNLAVIFNGNSAGNGVYAVHSSDRGLSWSDPEIVYLTYETDLVPFSLQMIQGQDNNAHAVWNVVTTTGVDNLLYYANLDLEQNSWSTPVLLDERIKEDGFFGPSFPVVVDNGQEIVVMYNGGNTNNSGEVSLGRPVQRVRQSSDGGRTWSEAINPFPRHLGRSGSHDLVLDSNGVAHALFIQRIDRNINGIYAPIIGLWHSTLENDGWSEPELFETGAIAGHDVKATVSQGNRLLVVMREDPGFGSSGVWYTDAELNVPEMPTMTPEVVLPAKTIDAVATPTPAPMRTNGLSDPVGSAMQEQSSNVSPNNQARAISLSLLPVFVLSLGIVIVIQMLRRHV